MIRPLATTFNKLHVNSSLKRDILFKRTGLFNIDQLNEPDGFHVLKDDAIKQANRLVDEIVTQPKERNNRNIVAIFDELSNCLCKVADLAEFVRVGHPHPRFRATAEHASVAISSLVEKFNTDTRLYNALQGTAFDDKLDEYVAKLFMFDFEQSGIHLDDDKRRQVWELNETILKLGSIFSSNANQPRTMSSQDVPTNIRNIFEASGDQLLISGLHADSDDELVREIAYKGYLQPDTNQEKVLTNLLSCRLQLAKLCGFDSYAHRAVKGGIAGSPTVVSDFLNLLNEQIKALANKDYKQMLELKSKSNGSNTSRLNAWDVPYYSASYKRGIYNEKVLQCLPYFSVGVCMEGLNMIFNRLYNVRLQVNTCTAGELWHNDVIKLSIIDEESNDLLGYIYCDLFERQGKQYQDCHHTIRGGCYLRDGSYQLPIVVLVLSLPKPKAVNPSLLTPSMVDNLFHEMGHAMHSMLARTKYQHITDPRVLASFARHNQTGEPMPSDLIKTWVQSKRVFLASETQLQVFYAALDQAYHGPRGIGSGELSSTEMLARIQSQYYSIPYVENTAWQLRFSHLVGYGAKYYSYLVSRAVGSAIWSKLFAADPLSRSAGARFRREVLSHGGGKPADQIAEDVLERRVDADFIARSVIASFQEPKLED